MFDAIDIRTGQKHTVFGVHKSGPLNQQTKFLVFEGDWRWVWSNSYRPVGTGLAQTQIDMLAPPEPADVADLLAA